MKTFKTALSLIMLIGAGRTIQTVVRRAIRWGGMRTTTLRVDVKGEVVDRICAYPIAGDNKYRDKEFLFGIQRSRSR